MGERSSNESTGPGDGPAWCVRRHTSLDHPEDRLHQSPAVHTSVVTGRPWLDAAPPRPVQVVARLVQQPGDALTWLDVAGEDDPAVRFTVTAASARQLVSALQTLLAMCDT